MPLLSSRSESLRYRHALIVFMAVLLGSSLVADALLVTQQRGELIDQAKGYAQRELRLIAAWLTASLNRNGIDGPLNTSLERWLAADPTVVGLTIRVDDRTVFRYAREEPAEYAFDAFQQLRLDGRQLRLSLVRDITRVERLLEQMRLHLIAGSTVFIILLGSFLWVTVRRMALLPMRRYEAELQVHRYRLERLVQERTSELSATNRNLRHEIHERQQAELELRRSTNRLSVLREIDQSILGARSLPAIADGALQHISELIPCQRAGVVLFDLEVGQAELIAVTATHEPTQLKSGRLFHIDVTGIPEALRRGEPFLVENISTPEHPSPMEQVLIEEGVQSYAMLPLIYGGDLLGVLLLGSGESGRCGTEVLEIAGEIADVLAVAIQQVRLMEQVQQHAEQLERRVEQRTRELKEAQTELEAFTYSISHDLRGHLWTVQGFTDLLAEKYAEALGPDGLDYVDSIADGARAMTVLLQDLLTYSHINRGELTPSPVDLDRLVADLKVRFDTRIAAREVSVISEAPLGTVLAHKSTLEQVLAQLLDNAITYVPQDRKPLIRLRTEMVEGRTRLWVEDNGVGIPPEQRKRIFRVFQRLHADEAYPGTGIGLAIVQRGIARMGGQVGVESAPGEGSRFWVELPTAELQ